MSHTREFESTSPLQEISRISSLTREFESTSPLQVISRISSLTREFERNQATLNPRKHRILPSSDTRSTRRIRSKEQGFNRKRVRQEFPWPQHAAGRMPRGDTEIGLAQHCRHAAFPVFLTLMGLLATLSISSCTRPTSTHKTSQIGEDNTSYRRSPNFSRTARTRPRSRSTKPSHSLWTGGRPFLFVTKAE